jgi:L-fuculose-phosphate aldolase
MTEATTESAIRTAIVEANAELERLQMNVCSTGNISVRWRDGMLITPSGCRVETLAPDHVVFVRFDGGWDGEFTPSSEWAMHRAVYQRVEKAGAVVHAHADNCVALSCFRRPIPSFHYMVQSFGGRDIPCVDYFPFGSQALGDAAGAALADRSACLLANHGMLARGATLTSAFDNAVKLEVLARQYLKTLSIGTPNLLTEAESEIIAAKYRSYGKPQAFGRMPRWLVP